MVSLQEIALQYPESLQPFKRNILREYLQYKILDSLFSSSYSNKLSFIGGTALRMIHNNQRFSEDLDFDNFQLNQDDFSDLSTKIEKDLELEGYHVDMRSVYKKAYRCYIKFPEVLFHNQLSPFKEETILIQLDTESQDFRYEPEKFILNKFDVFTQIQVTPLSIILSQKILTIFRRKRPKGRDFYDLVFLFPRAKPNFGYLEAKLGIRRGEHLKSSLLSLCDTMDFNALAKDVSPFLFSARDSRKVLLFKDFIQNLDVSP